MLLNASQVEGYLNTRGLGEKQQVGYDLTVKEIKSINGGIVLADKTVVDDYAEILPFKNANGRFVFKLDPGTYSLTFEQGCKLDNKHTAFIRHRSSILRCGGIITSGIYDSGFTTDEMGAVLIATKSIIIEKGARCAQFYVFENYEAELYNGQWQSHRDYK